MLVVGQALPPASSPSHVLNSVAAFLLALPQVVFPYWRLVPQDDHHWLLAWYDRAPVLGTGTAWGITVLQWGIVAVAFGALARRLKQVRQVLLSAVATIVLVTAVVLGLFALLKLTVQVEYI